MGRYLGLIDRVLGIRDLGLLAVGDAMTSKRKRDRTIGRRFKSGRTFAQLYREFGRHVVDRVIRAGLHWPWAHRRSTMSRDWVRAQRQQAIKKSAEVDGVSWTWPVRKEVE